MIRSVFLATEVTVSVLMAVVDFIPVVFFMFAMGAVIRIAYQRIGTVSFAVLTGGVFLGFFAGLAKCTWKLLYAFGTDFVPLNTSFAVYQTVGFGMIAYGCVVLATNELRRGKALPKASVVKSLACALPLFLLFFADVVVIEKAGFLWYIAMALFTCTYLIALSLLAFKVKRLCGLWYYASMVTMFLMVGLKSQFEEGGSFETMNWIAQVTNVVTQCLVILPTHLLSHNYPLKRIQVLN